MSRSGSRVAHKYWFNGSKTTTKKTEFKRPVNNKAKEEEGKKKAVNEEGH